MKLKNMKLKQLSIACATALLSSQAMAWGPTVVPDQTISISGSSAQDKAVKALVGSLCVSGTLDTFKDTANPLKKGKGYTSYFCTIDSTQVAGMSANKKVLINKRSAGGSGEGVQPVADATPIETMNINNGNCIDNGNRTWGCSIAGGTTTGNLVMRMPDAGISDVEPAMFTGPNVPAGSTAVTPAQVGRMDISTMNAVVFGVPVTTNLYRALQIAEGFNPALDNEANMPSLSSAQINGLITGGLSKWNQLVINGTPLTAYPGVTPPAMDVIGSFSNPLVHYCRRVPGSGTQAQMNAIFANTPCAAGVKQPLRAPGNPLSGPLVQENAGSGDMTVCLRDNNTANKWAIGIQGLEKSDASFRFIKIDGVAPTIKNVADNKYKDWVETSMQWRNAVNNGPSGDTLAILKTIASDASAPATINVLNQKFVHGFGVGAFLALNTNGYTPSYPFNPVNPVTTATHAPLGTPNTCNRPVVNVKSEL